MSIYNECVLLFKEKIGLLDLSTSQSLTKWLIDEFNIVTEREKSMLVFVNKQTDKSILIKANVDEAKILDSHISSEKQKLEERKKVYF